MIGDYTYDQLRKEIEELKLQLGEATDTIHAIRTGQVDALIVEGKNGNELYTLKTADQTYRVFIEKMNEGAVTLNEQGIILYCNSAFGAIVDMPISKVIGLSFHTFVSDEFKDPYHELFTDGWSYDGKLELTILGKNKAVPCQLSVAALELDEGISLSLIITNLTLQKQSQNLLKRNNTQLQDTIAAMEITNHDLQQFASVASHDLQEPLRKIMIFASIIKEKYGSELSVDTDAYLEKIIAASNRMKSLVTDILSHSRLSSKEQNFSRTDLNEVVSEILTDYELLIADKKANIVVGTLPVIEANTAQLRQVFQNLISNALKFSIDTTAPVINITANIEEAENGSVPLCHISVSDNGIGFDEKFSSAIFSLFARLNTKDKYEGSGIGLAITKKILEKHNGSITAISKEGSGSEFIITLPIKHTHS
ncbi:MAG: PAS domain-containing protein [Taibaiella sp.]|nr:PAS domain-containing protein [Taibaiella sp.]